MVNSRSEKINDLGTMEESVEECVEVYVVLGSFGVFEKEGTTPNSLCFKPSQGQGRRASTVSRPPGTRLLKVSEGLGKAKQLGRCADSDDGQSTHKQLSLL